MFICENNQYSMGTPMERTNPVPDVTLKGAGYGMPIDRFDGHDVEVVQERLKAAVARARRGEGPTLVEICTYRFRGHSMSDPGKYRTAEEVDEMKRTRDPVRIARDRLSARGVSEDSLAKLDEEVEAEVQGAVSFADAAPPALAATVNDTVLAPSIAYPPRFDGAHAPFVAGPAAAAGRTEGGA